MNYYHKNLARGGWKKLSFVERMANTGMELSRAFRWKNKNRRYCQEAFARFLELLGFTIKEESDFCRLRELTRVREVILDYFYGDNCYATSEDFWKKYFYHFAYAARINK
jgi:hypothetical protein